MVHFKSELVQGLVCPSSFSLENEEEEEKEEEEEEEEENEKEKKRSTSKTIYTNSWSTAKAAPY